ncbi:NAD(P)/FAD-dependent oxidoreductase [Dermatophilaceae bacterium Soc4.6]
MSLALPRPDDPAGRAPRAIVVGAGFGGVAAAVRLKQAGVEDLVVVDSAQAVGGVWLANRYPGCACDIPAPLYSFSFAPNPHWSSRFPPADEIQAYLEAVVDRFDLRRHLALGTEVVRAVWHEASTTWAVETADGRVLECDLLVTAVGQLSKPAVPQIKGLETFGGPVVHSARWTPDLDVAGRRVAVIGSGASAIQIVPVIAGPAEHVTVLQRSAPWTLPKPARRYGRVSRALKQRVPASMHIGRETTWRVTQLMGLAVTGNAVASGALRLASTAQRRIQLRDPELRRRATPDHRMGCKRVLFTSTWFPALARPDVDLVTEAIDRVEEEGVRTADGRLHRADVLVLGTGFAATDLVAPLEVVGRAGTRLADAWAGGAHAYLGLSVPGFPNLFLVYGPNTNTGNTSVVYFHEAQAGYIAQAARLLAAQGGGALEVRTEVEAAYDTELLARLDRSVWATCSSWYRAASGRIVTNWPGSASEYARRTARLDPADFLVTARGPAEVGAE